MGISCKHCSSNSATQQIALANMKVAIVLTVLCIAPAVLGDIDVDAIFGKFQAPFKCGQCRAAFSEAKDQLCQNIEIDFPYLDFEGFCKAFYNIKSSPVANVFC